MTVGGETATKDRKVPKISMANFAVRKDEIAKEIIHAAENNGFFIVENQESPSVAEIEEMFALSERYFHLPVETKSATPFIKAENTGWETCSQIRPSTGLPDQKESLQLQYHRLGDRTWPQDPSIPEFAQTVSSFMEKTQALSMNILSIFALALGFPEDFFVKAHDVTRTDAQSTIRLLHYHDITGTQFPSSYWRAGSHTDYDCLTMLFQKTGEEGLEICPGREAHTSFGTEDHWTPVKARTGEVVCNIGDMLMAWSDDRFKSLYHRVRCPGLGERQTSRYSIAYFNQANKDVEIRGPLGKYPVMTAHKYIQDAIQRNYGGPGKVDASTAA